MANKIGYHIQAASPMQLFFSLLSQFNFRSAGFTVVGAIGQIYDVVQQLGPDKSKITGRETTLEDTLLDPAKGTLADPVVTAITYIHRLYNAVTAYPGLDQLWWQVFNERMSDYEWMDRFIVAILAENKKLPKPLKLVLVNYATGNPEIEDWHKMRASLTAICKDPNARIGLHEYGFNGKMLGEGSLETWRIGRYLRLKTLLLSWGLSITKKLVIDEYGLDDPGWQNTGVSLTEYAQQLIDANKKYYANDSFVVTANIYDVSYLAEEYNALPQTESGTHTDLMYMIDEYIKTAGQDTTPDPVPQPDPTPNPQPTPVVWEPVALFKNGDFNAGFSKASADWNLPAFWSNWQAVPTAQIHYEDEMHFTHVADGFSHAARFYTGYEPIDAGLLQRVDVINGQTYRLSGNVFKWSTQNAVVDSPSEFYSEAYLGIDPTGGTNPFSLSTVWVEVLSNMDEILSGELVVKAASNKITLFLRGVGKWPVARTDFFWSNIRLDRLVTGIPNPTPEPAPTTGLKKTLVNANLRGTPEALADNSNKIAVVNKDTTVNVIEVVGEWSKIEGYIKTSLLGEGG